MAARTATKPKIDYILISVTLMLACLGVLLIFDASYAYALQRHISAYKYVGFQAAWALIGTIAMLVMRKVHYRKLENAAIMLIGFSIIALIAVFIPHIGAPAVNGAHRWLGIGAAKFQPSEIAKLAIVLYIARLCAGRPKTMSNFVGGPLAPICVLGLMAFLVDKEPDLGTCLVLLGAGLGALFFAGMKIRHFAMTLAVALVLIGGMLYMKSHSHEGSGTNYRGGRVTAWLHPNDSHTAEGYQVYHGMIALGTGGALGLGVGNGRQKYYLPEAHTDFIFATLAEEGGLLASLFVLALFAVLIGRGMHIASMTKDPFGAILAGGITAGLATQALLNLAVVTTSVPATGVPLPFLSYGGTSLFVSMLGVGILLSIHRNSEWDDDGRTEIAEHAPDRDFDRRWNKGATLSRPEYARGGAYRGSDGYRESGRKAKPHAPVGR